MRCYGRWWLRGSRRCRVCDLDCASCGQTFNAARLDGLVHENDEFTCDDCGAVNVVSFDGDEAHVGHWRCKHGTSGDDGCRDCHDEMMLDDGIRALAPLLHSLHVAGALHVARIGGGRHADGYWRWRPGCGRPHPMSVLDPPEGP